MSAVSILTPVVNAMWPAFSAAVTSAAKSLGFTVVAGRMPQRKADKGANRNPTINLAIENSQIVTHQLGRDQRIAVTRNGVTVTFSRDDRGKASLCVTGTGQTEEALRKIGEELSGRVVQRYVYDRLVSELGTRHFAVIQEEVDDHHAIHLKVRRWDG